MVHAHHRTPRTGSQHRTPNHQFRRVNHLQIEGPSEREFHLRAARRRTPGLKTDAAAAQIRNQPRPQVGDAVQVVAEPQRDTEGTDEVRSRHGLLPAMIGGSGGFQ